MSYMCKLWQKTECILRSGSRQEYTASSLKIIQVTLSNTRQKKQTRKNIQIQKKRNKVIFNHIQYHYLCTKS